MWAVANVINAQNPFDTEMDMSEVTRPSNKKVATAQEFVQEREAVIRFVKDSIAEAVDRQKRNADRHGRANLNTFKIGDKVLLSTATLPEHAVSCLGSSKLLPKYVGPFTVVHKRGDAYTLDLPTRMRTHPTFYVGRLRPFWSHRVGESLPSQDTTGFSCSGEASPLVLASTPPLSTPRSTQLSEPRSTRDEAHHSFDALASKDGEDENIYPPPPPPLKDSTGQSRWTVERILDQKVQDRRRYYRVRWMGYPPSSDTWEPATNLVTDVPDLVADYEQARS
jgi:hypothetical protein